MLERLLKAVFGVMLVVLYTQRIFFPMLDEVREDRRQLARLEGTVQTYRSGDLAVERKRLQIEQEMVRAGHTQLRNFLPRFDQARERILSKFEPLRQGVKGIWEVKPASTFTTEPDLVRWPVKISFEGDFHAALQVLAMIEADGQLVRLGGVELSGGKQGRVRLQLDCDLLFAPAEAVAGPFAAR